MKHISGFGTVNRTEELVTLIGPEVFAPLLLLVEEMGVKTPKNIHKFIESATSEGYKFEWRDKGTPYAAIRHTHSSWQKSHIVLDSIRIREGG